MSKKILECDVMSAIQPTGELHIGKYFGAVKNWVTLQEKKRCIYGIVDFHAMTGDYNQSQLQTTTNQMMIDLIACGLDPKKSTLFVQSLVPEHTELAWILGVVTSFGDLSRQTQFKSKRQGNSEESISAGLFNYPLLQAADILIYRAEEVPVGQDQKQHLELCRDIARKFNNKFGEVFPIPEPKFSSTPKIMSLADPTKKMSSSLGEKHFISIFEEENSLRKKVMDAKTDSGDEKEGEMSLGVKNLFNLLGACEKDAELISLTNDFNSGQLKYKLLKETLADALVELSTEMRKRRSEVETDVSLLNDTIREMSREARALAQDTLYEVKQRVGVKSVSHF